MTSEEGTVMTTDGSQIDHDTVTARPERPALGVAAVSPLTRDFLSWVASTPRSYADTMGAWRTSCPRFPIWEDALGDGLVHVVSGSGVTMDEAAVVLTDRGRAVLGG
jgi:hypothetical protein